MRAVRERGSYLLYLAPGALLVLAVVLVPFGMNVGISFTEWSGVGEPEWTGLDNYGRLLSDGTFWASFRHNLALVVAMAVLPTLAGLVVAATLVDYIGKHFGARQAAVLRACVYLPQVLPIAVAGIVWSWILAPKDGALNAALRALGLEALARNWLGDPDLALWSLMGVLLWMQLGYPVVIFMAGMSRLDPALHEAAELDGASWWGRFRHVTVPGLRPEIFVVLLTCTIAALKVFAPIYVLTRGGPAGATNVPAYYSFQNFFERTRVGYGAAIATVLTVLVLVLTAVFLRVQQRGER
ncbi:carbohydrate ABC transporter permease [Saccharothrix variisporea]|uniref:Carbohydrate ABC transporter membrane protein 1 (CUT1 family) n=1 Tax=Saccharothrix variisporea TaxID=543527 RepID=A0A495X324_9PSEU|nr:sugar ABC transporter permease [Saccharothrix variisporea]RKT67906.1 carbohydrate ABC transporter membrane protein 1 (CUT1 family) [Saccharothrix variisporea]